MVNHSYECSKCGHLFDKLVKWDQRYAKCQECGKRAERSWTLSKSRRFSEPVVLHCYADGSYGVPGRADSATPAGAERIECWHMADYERALGKMNASERAKATELHEIEERRRDERNQQIREVVKERLAQSNSEWEKEMLRATLENTDRGYRPLQFREFYNEALER